MQPKQSKSESVENQTDWRSMPKTTAITRDQLIQALNEDLSREYQAIISYVNYSQVLKGAAHMKIADDL